MARNGAVELEYETFGDPANEAVLLINGLGSQMTRWPEPFCNLLVDKGLFAIRFDNRDVGLSTWLDGQSYTTDDMAAEEHSVHDALVEGIVVADDDLMERYLADDKIDTSELGHALAKGIDEATVFPVLCGSATKLVGVDRLARFVVEEGPEPHVTGDDGQTALFVFKTIVDPYVGHVKLFKVLQGVLRPDDTLVNGRTVHDERLHQISTMRGKEQEPAKELHAGDIGAVAKLGDTSTGDVLAERGTDISVEPFTIVAGE